METNTEELLKIKYEAEICKACKPNLDCKIEWPEPCPILEAVQDYTNEALRKNQMTAKTKRCKRCGKYLGDNSDVWENQAPVQYRQYCDLCCYYGWPKRGG